MMVLNLSIQSEPSYDLWTIDTSWQNNENVNESLIGIHHNLGNHEIDPQIYDSNNPLGTG
jgi:hypothetical protein